VPFWLFTSDILFPLGTNLTSLSLTKSAGSFP
jgi:hypothetical protein